jgi:EF-P beta-lysylation protein EpmB
MLDTLVKPRPDCAQTDRDWKTIAAESIRKLDDLLEYCGIDRSHAEVRSTGQFPLRVTRYFASLIEKGNPRDPLLLQVLPVANELRLADGYSRDAVDDQSYMPVPGLIHKYHGRVLLTMTGACAVHCRYCFRRHFPYAEASADYKLDERVMDYLSRHVDVSEVILSGGDPLMLSDRRLAELVDNLNRIPHIDTLRIHSRLMSVLPERINEGLLEVLRGFNGQLVLVTHINHPNEISAANQAAFSRLAQQGYPLFNQSVLLKGVNDNVQVLADLSRKLFESRVVPYYLHQLDKVQGAAHFEVPPEDSRKLYDELRGRLPGYLLPALVVDIPGENSKLPLSID